MSEISPARRVFWNRADIPTGTKAIIVRVQDPLITLISPESPEEELPVFEEKVAYVEITLDEWAAVKDDQSKANALVKQFGGLIQESLGASWHRWHDTDNLPPPDAHALPPSN